MGEPRLEEEEPLPIEEPGEASPPDPPEQRPVDVVLTPVHAFAAHRVSGAGLLLLAAVVAMAVAQSGGAEGAAHLLETQAGLVIGEWQLQKTLHHWVNDGLMSIFFFVVGLEIKRELLVGELASVRRAILPALAAVGGMVVPALLYALFTRGTPTLSGWGIPMATDIAFALGVLALLGSRVPPGLKVFLTALAIVDDIGAVLVIAVFYTASVTLPALAVGLGALLVSTGMNRLGVRSAVAYLIVGLVVWAAFLRSGVHATIAALLMAFTIPARTRLDGKQLLHNMEWHLRRLRQLGLPPDRRLNSGGQQAELEHMAVTVEQAGAPLQRLEHLLTPVTTFLVLPIFALANAGVSLSSGVLDQLTAPVTLGVVLGLCVGKPLGIVGFTWLATRSGLSELPRDISLAHVVGAGLLAGVGFTMAVFIAGLAFDSSTPTQAAKLGILAASTLSGVLGYLWLRRTIRRAT